MSGLGIHRLHPRSILGIENLKGMPKHIPTQLVCVFKYNEY